MGRNLARVLTLDSSMNILPFFADKPRLFEVVHQPCMKFAKNDRYSVLPCFLIMHRSTNLTPSHFARHPLFKKCFVDGLFGLYLRTWITLWSSTFLCTCHTLQAVLATGSCNLKSLPGFSPTHLPGTVESLSRRGCSSSTRNLKRADLTTSP